MSQFRPVTVGELFSLYLEKTARDQSPRTLEERKRLLDLYAHSQGDREISSLIPADLELWVKDFPAWKSDWTIHRALATIQRPFNWARRLGLIQINPFAGMTHPTGPRGKPLTDVDYRKMLRKSRAVFRRILIFAHWTGARPCEVSQLQWSMINAGEGTATLQEHKTARTRKDREPRVLYLPAVALKMLVWIRKRWPMEQRVFLNASGRPWNRNSLTLRVQRLRLALGLAKAVRLYGLRHSWATRLAKGGVELKTLATLLGHSTCKMAEHYIHLAGQTKYLRNALERGLSDGKKD